MRRIGLSVVAVVVVSCLGSQAYALPSFGADCSGCHNGARGTMTITGNDATANPTETCGSPDRGLLKVFQVTQGATKTLSGTLSGVADGAAYAVVIKGFEATGAEHCGAISYTGDSAWNQDSTSAPVYYTQPLAGGAFTWPGTSTFDFDITVGAATPPDYYDLVLASAGMDGTGKFYTESHLYVQVVEATPSVPTIALNKTSLAPTAIAGVDAASETFTVSNTGSGTLNYAISDDATWLTVSPASGSTTGAAKTITVQYSTASMAAGSYPATITVSDATATNNPQTIGVTLTVTAAATPAITLSKATLEPTSVAGANPPDDSFTVSNTGTGTLNYAVTDDAEWLTVTPASGSTEGPAGTITVQYATASMAAGAYAATITVADPTATNNPQTINVTLTISAAEAKPIIELSAEELSPVAAEGANPPDDTFTVNNTGAGTLNYVVTSSASWLTVSPASGSTTGPASTITVHYDTALLAGGAYSATITVSDPNAIDDPQTITVILTITEVSDEPGDEPGDDQTGGPSAPPVFGLCGSGVVGVVPAMFLGLVGLRADVLRRRSRGSARTDRR